MTKCNNECIRTKHRNDEEKRELIKRLNIIEGQINGIKKMIEEDRYCDDVLIQIAAINKALNSLGNSMLKSHLETCIVEEIQKGNTDIINEVIDLFGRLK